MPNAKLVLDVGRQQPLFGEVNIDFSNITDTGVAVQALGLPYGAQVIGGSVVVDTAFNPTGTGAALTLNVGDQLVANRYLAAVNLAAVGRTALVPTGYASDGGDIFVVPTLVGTAATAGKARLNVQYVIRGRAGEVQPN